MIEVRGNDYSRQGQGFTQVRPLLIEVKTYFLLLYYCFVYDLDYKDPAPTILEPATSLSLRAYRSKVQDPPYKGGGSLDLQSVPSSTLTQSPTLGFVLPN